jgi:MFS family permease
MSPASAPATASSKRNLYAVLIAAFLGWMFDGFEQALFPLIGQPALAELLGPTASSGDAAKWFGAIIAVFLIGAASGGVFFGWLGDKIGRTRAMSLSILTYAVFTGLCGFATEAWHIAVLRFFAALGMGGEWSLGVALVNEVWPGKSRVITAGLIGAAANVGYLLVAVLSMVMLGFITHLRSLLHAIGCSEVLITRLLSNSGWRFLMIVGALPALLIFFIRLFVPESEKWQQEKARGSTTHWQNADLLGVMIGMLAGLVIIWIWSPIGISGSGAVLLTAVLFFVSLFGFLYPVRVYLRRAQTAGSLSGESSRRIVRLMLFGALISSVAMLGTWGSMQWAPRWALQFAPEPARLAKEWTMFWMAAGAIVGTMTAALCAGRFGRRPTYTLLCVGSLVSVLTFYLANSSYGALFLPTVFFAGGITAAFFGFFPLYLPELFPTAVRATAQGFAYNFGRIIAAVGGLQTAVLMSFFGGSFALAGSWMAAIYVFGAIVIWFGPETRTTGLPD